MTTPTRAGFVFLLVTLCAQLAAGQTFRGNISGSVTDATGAAIAQAMVKASNDATGVARSTLTTSTGDFLFADMPLGKYTVMVESKGFQTATYREVEVAVSRVTNLSVSLNVAQQVAQVEVVASTATVETTSTALVGVISPKLVADLPMNGRDFRQMLKLAPGVNPQTSAVNGNRSSGNNWQIDGADNNDAFHNTTAVNQGGVSGIAGTLLPVEAIDQFAVVTSAGADMGRNGGSNVNLVIKSGTNGLHGSAYYFNRNEALASITPFQAPGSKKRVIRNNQYGFSVGGPVVKNKLFYFVTGEAQDAIAAFSSLGTHPSTAWVGQARGVLARFNVPESPIARNVLAAWPSRYNDLGAATNNLLANDLNVYDSYNGIAKVDYNINSKHAVAVRYFGGSGKQAASTGALHREYYQVAPSRMHNVSVVMNSMISPRLMNQLILGANFFLQVFNDYDTSFDPVAAGLNTGVTEATLKGTPSLRISNFAGAGYTQPLGRIDTTGHLTDNISFTTGRHQMKFGGEYRKAHLDVFYDTNKRGSFTWDGTRGPWATAADVSAPLRALSDFLAMLPSNSTGASIVRGQLQRDYRQSSFDWWAHDNWQVSPKLNINFGVRYTFHGVLHDTRNSITTFVPGSGFLAPGVNADRLYPNDLNNLAPRVGVAYTPGKDRGLVIRAAWGLFYDTPALNFFVANTGFANGGAAGVHANPGGPAPVYTINLAGTNTVIQPGVPVFGSAAPRPPFGTFGINQDLSLPYIQNYNLNVQKALGGKTLAQVAYVGSTSRKLTGFQNINAPTPGTTGELQSRRPYSRAYPDLSVINMIQTAGNAQYHSLQTSIRVSRLAGWTLNANYTWAKAIDKNGDPRNVLPANSYDLSRERGPSGIDLRHIFTGFAGYEVPVFTERARLLTRGWQVNSLLTLHTGSPLDLLAGVNRSNSFDNRDRVDVVGEANPGAGDRVTPYGAIRYFNPAAFALPAVGSFGNIGRNAIRGPGFGAVDFSVFKSTPITEKISTQLRVEIFNLTNRSNWANPGTSFNSSSSFGLITSTRNGGGAPGLGLGEPRNIQLALKLIW
ncbi:MAG: carboxypeptidase regulatory-like domain-containing protein [Acidobacteria bacterium]|nr:carboxypeptidase regulatory-like domain-containing protein [Acidobacteriota bacterium]